MYYTMASKLVLNSNNLLEHSQGVEIIGNAVRLDLTLFSISGGATVSVGLQAGNDLENWTTFGTGVQPTTVGYATITWTGIAFKYARLLYVINTGTAAVAAGIWTSEQ